MNSEITLDSVIKAYPLPETAFSQDFWKLALSARHQQSLLEREGNADEGMAINNALYLLLSKYIPKAEISSDSTVYLKNLLSAIKQARYEFSEVCYASDYASDVFQAFYAFVLSELARVENSIQAPAKTLEPSPPSNATSTDDGQDNKHSPESRSGRLIKLLRKALVSPLVTYLFYLLPAGYFFIQIPHLIRYVATAYFIAYCIHVFLMANDPDDKKGIELCIISAIFLTVTFVFSSF